MDSFSRADNSAFSKPHSAAADHESAEEQVVAAVAQQSRKPEVEEVFEVVRMQLPRSCCDDGRSECVGGLPVEPAVVVAEVVVRAVVA